MTSLANVIATNKAAGQHFFEDDTMDFFKSRLVSDLIHDRYFITSEKGPVEGSARRYTVREAIEGGKNIRTVGEFQAYANLAEAARAIAKLIP